MRLSPHTALQWPGSSDWAFAISATVFTHAPVRLPPFAWSVAFPRADYSGGSVALWLAPFRRSRVPAVFDVRARFRCPTHDLARPRWSVPVGRRAETSQACAGSVPTAPRRAWCGGRCVAPLVIGVRAIQLSPCRAGLAGRCPTRLRAVPRSQHAPVGDPRSSLLISLPAGVIEHRVTRRTA